MASKTARKPRDRFVPLEGGAKQTTQTVGKEYTQIYALCVRKVFDTKRN